MSRVTPYLELLAELRGELAENLAYMGVEASDSETLQTLVPKVLQILQGDPAQELFTAEMLALSPSYGFYSTGETAALAGVCKITLCNRVASASVTVSGSGVSALTVTAPGWSIARTASAVTLTRAVSCRAELERALDAVTLAGDDSTEVLAQITVGVTFQSGESAAASGSAELKFSYQTNWKLFEELYGYTWAELEAAGITWSDLETLGKPAGG